MNTGQYSRTVDDILKENAELLAKVAELQNTISIMASQIARQVCAQKTVPCTSCTQYDCPTIFVNYARETGECPKTD